MISKFWYLKYYNIKDSLVLLWALFIDSLHARIPKQVFLIKNTYQALRQKNAQILREKNEITINLDSCLYRLRLSGSDFDVFNQVVLKEELKTLTDFASQLDVKHLQIIDCGANIGLSSLVFKRNFPNSKIISVEPEKTNYLQLCKNIELNKLSDVTAIEMGVWHRETRLEPDHTFRDKSNWSFALKETSDFSNNGVKVDSISNITKNAGWTRIDLLKIDIEGSEFEIFRNLHTWKSIFDTVKIVSIEVHEEIGPVREIETILLENGFWLQKSGELLIGVRN
jgi:FkbM family methyltransferase